MQRLRAQLRYHYAITGCTSGDPPLWGARVLSPFEAALDLSSPIAVHTSLSPLAPLSTSQSADKGGHVTYFYFHHTPSFTKKTFHPPLTKLSSRHQFSPDHQRKTPRQKKNLYCNYCCGYRIQSDGGWGYFAETLHASKDPRCLVWRWCSGIEQTKFLC